jgi:hypothetical protein
MPRSVNSFDVFGTLVARRCVEPRLVLTRLETESGVPDLAEARLAADRKLWDTGHPYKLTDLWREAGQVLGLSEADAVRLLELEVAIEHDEVIPIAENLARVRDGDLLVSDTYLPAEVVRSLLRRAGLDRQVALVATNDGKSRGWVWPQILTSISIRRHLGDDPHSDGRSPAAHGIESAIYAGAAPSPVERLLAESGWGTLAEVIREVRLANPFPETRPRERHLWWMSCQLNFPLLTFASILLEGYCEANGIEEVFFVSRDCHVWIDLFKALFPQRRATYLYASRICALKPTEHYLEYFLATWHPGGVVVDLSSTGASWASLFARLGTRGRCWFIGLIDNFSYLPGAPDPARQLEVTSVYRDSELAGVNKGVEMLNYAPHARIEDVLLLPGGAALPVLADELEYDSAPASAARDSFAACLRALTRRPIGLTERDPADLGELVQTFVRLICGDRQLPAAYPRHLEADLAYERRILG